MGGKRKGNLRDKYPQTLKGSVVMPSGGSNDTATTAQITLPLDPFGSGTTKMLMEILGVDYELFNVGAMNSDTGWMWVAVGLSTLKTGMNTTDQTTAASYFLADPYTISEWSWNFGVAAASLQLPIFGRAYQDLTDGQGNGQLVAVPNLYLTVASANTGCKVGCRVSIKYRFNAVNVNEWVGMMQSQQSGN